MSEIKKPTTAAKVTRIPIPKEHIQSKLYAFAKNKYRKLLKSGFAVYNDSSKHPVMTKNTFNAVVFVIKAIKSNLERKVLIIKEQGYHIQIDVTKVFLTEGKGIIGIKDEYKDDFNRIIQQYPSLKKHVTSENFVQIYETLQKRTAKIKGLTFRTYKSRMKNVISSMLRTHISITEQNTKDITLQVNVVVDKLNETDLYRDYKVTTGEELRNIILQLDNRKLLDLISKKYNHFYSFIIDCLNWFLLNDKIPSFRDHRK